MKLILITFIVSFSLIGNTVFAQIQRGGMSPPDFNAIEVAGIIKYDSEKVIKKLKINEDSLSIETAKHIRTYNLEIENLLLLHSKTLQDLEKEFDRNVKIAIQNRDRSQMNKVKAKIKQYIPPIRQEVQKHKKILNETLAELLNEKQYKKWLRYQKSKKPNNSDF